MNADDFQRVKDRDRQLKVCAVEEWMVRWEWAQQYHKYNGPSDLIRWFEWGSKRPHYFSDEQIRLFANLSEVKNRKILREVSGGRSYSFQNVDEYNATDYLFQNLYPVPSVLPGFPGDFSLGKNGVTTMTAPKNAGKPGCGRFDRKAARAGARRSPPCSF